jgi:hypothetical protein
LNDRPYDEGVVAEVRNVAPSGSPELSVRTSLAGVGREGGEDAEFEFGERERLTFPPDAMGEVVHLEPARWLDEPEASRGRGCGTELAPPTFKRVSIGREDHDRSEL